MLSSFFLIPKQYYHKHFRGKNNKTVEQAIDKNIAMATPNLGPIDTSKLAGQPPQDTFVPSKAATAPQA